MSIEQRILNLAARIRALRDDVHALADRVRTEITPDPPPADPPPVVRSRRAPGSPIARRIYRQRRTARRRGAPPPIADTLPDPIPGEAGTSGAPAASPGAGSSPDPEPTAPLMVETCSARCGHCGTQVLLIRAEGDEDVRCPICRRDQDPPEGGRYCLPRPASEHERRLLR